MFLNQNLQGGNKIVGQLGHGNTAAYKTPKKVEAFEGVGVIQAECGEDFTVCLSGIRLILSLSVFKTDT